MGYGPLRAEEGQSGLNVYGWRSTTHEDTYKKQPGVLIGNWWKNRPISSSERECHPCHLTTPTILTQSTKGAMINHSNPWTEISDTPWRGNLSPTPPTSQNWTLQLLNSTTLCSRLPWKHTRTQMWPKSSASPRNFFKALETCVATLKTLAKSSFIIKPSSI